MNADAIGPRCGAHISRTMMLAELGAVLANVPQGSGAADYREAILQRNVLGKTTDSTRQKSLRHLREPYALDEATPTFALLRKLHAIDATSLLLLAVQVAWGRDPPLRSLAQFEWPRFPKSSRDRARHDSRRVWPLVH